MRRLTLAPLLLSLACASGIGVDVDCPPEGTELTYENFGKAYFEQHCLECHSSSVTGTARNGAPPTVDFDQLQQIRIRLQAIDFRRHDMPPADRSRPSIDDQQKLSEWLACGAP